MGSDKTTLGSLVVWHKRCTVCLIRSFYIGRIYILFRYIICMYVVLCKSSDLSIPIEPGVSIVKCRYRKPDLCTLYQIVISTFLIQPVSNLYLRACVCVCAGVCTKVSAYV